ncbi:S-protein homolog 29-like [Lactuca sativa]|uniref:S-protein homolog 29-like n=1 Tax=Lactuca sativa TaxID=4236 RepID=UPI000CD7F741|nr:S-protein homolog 29-like [Lactuca sativa]
MAACGGSMAAAMAAMLIISTSICVSSGKKITVQITNLIRYDNAMVIDCRSSDDDLGQQTLLYGQSMEWRFNPNFSKTTLYYCNAMWEAKQIHFHAYEYMRDNYGCGLDCRWLFTVDGLYAYNSKNESWDFRFSCLV